MPHKQFLLDDTLPFTIYKRKGSRSLRLSINSAGEVRVSIPTWAPYSAGVTFAKSRRDWILEQRRPDTLLANGQAVGKAHHLSFEPSSKAAKPASRVTGGIIKIVYPIQLNIADAEVQKAAREGCVKALRKQAEQLLPQRLANLATQHDFTYGSVSVKRLKSRWGSCDQNKNITLNLFLMQLPWNFIDYVLLHELTHTRIMRHGPVFWQEMEQVLPDARQLRKQLHEYRPVLDGSIFVGMP